MFAWVEFGGFDKRGKGLVAGLQFNGVVFARLAPDFEHGDSVTLDMQRNLTMVMNNCRNLAGATQMLDGLACDAAGFECQTNRILGHDVENSPYSSQSITDARPLCQSCYD